MIINSEKELSVFAASLVRDLKAPLVVGLRGVLGAGKTTLVRYILESMGFSDAVSSPTFVLEHQYSNGQIKIEHWDLYRLTTLPEDLFEAPRSDVVRFIEWSDKFPELAVDMEISIEVVGFGESRKIVVSKRTILNDKIT